MANETRPTTDNYLKSLPILEKGQARFEFFCSAAPAHVTRAAQWARREVNQGRRVSIHHRVEGLEDLIEVGEFDPADLAEPN